MPVYVCVPVSVCEYACLCMCVYAQASVYVWCVGLCVLMRIRMCVIYSLTITAINLYFSPEGQETFPL